MRGAKSGTVAVMLPRRSAKLPTARVRVPSVLVRGPRNGSSYSRSERSRARLGLRLDRSGLYIRVVGRSSSVSLLEIEPDLAGLLSEEERTEAQRFLLPVAGVDKGGDVAELLEAKSGFGAIVLGGLLVQALQINEDSTLRLIGPGSFVPPVHLPRSTRFRDARLRAGSDPTGVARRRVAGGCAAVAVDRVVFAHAYVRGLRRSGQAVGNLPTAASRGSHHGHDVAVG